MQFWAEVNLKKNSLLVNKIATMYTTARALYLGGGKTSCKRPLSLNLRTFLEVEYNLNEEKHFCFAQQANCLAVTLIIILISDRLMFLF